MKRLSDEAILEAKRRAYNRPDLELECVSEQDRVVARKAEQEILR